MLKKIKWCKTRSPFQYKDIKKSNAATDEYKPYKPHPLEKSWRENWINNISFSLSLAFKIYFTSSMNKKEICKLVSKCTPNTEFYHNIQTKGCLLSQDNKIIRGDKTSTTNSLAEQLDRWPWSLLLVCSELREEFANVLISNHLLVLSKFTQVLSQGWAQSVVLWV